MDLPHDNAEMRHPVLAAGILEDSKELYGNSNGPDGERCINPQNVEEMAEFFDQFKLWQLDDKSVGIVDGSFDVEQPNHLLYLIQCRIAVAAHRENSRGGNWAKLSGKEKQERIESDKVVLVVTIDADEKVQALKGGRTDKGGVTRPVYPWDVRAQRVANYTIGADDWSQRPVADIATIEGADHHSDTPLESFVELATYLSEEELVDLVIMFQQEKSHSNTTTKLRKNGVDPFELPAHNTYIDPRTEAVYSSSDIIKQIRGTK